MFQNVILLHILWCENILNIFKNFKKYKLKFILKAKINRYWFTKEIKHETDETIKYWS